MVIIEFLLTIVLLFFILGLLVFVHELGHFLAAKMVGVEVEEFAFGFGKNIYAKRYKDTVYKINLIFLGGYVKLLGDEDGSSFRHFEAKNYSKVDIKRLLNRINEVVKKDDKTLISKIRRIKSSKLSKDEKKELLDFIYHYLLHNDKNFIENKSFFARFFILVAGVLMNVLLAIVIFAIFLIISNFKTNIAYITDYNFLGADVKTFETPIVSVIYNENLKTELFPNGQDKTAFAMISIDSHEIESVEDFKDIWKNIENKEILLEYMYLDSPKKYTKNVILNSSGYDTNIDPELEKKIVFFDIKPDSPAERGGLESGDILLKVNGVDSMYENAEDFVSFLDENEKNSIDFTVLKVNGEIKNLTVKLNSKQDSEFVLGASLGVNKVFAVKQYELDYSENKYLSGVYHSINMFGYNAAALGEIFWLSFKYKDPALATNSLSSVWGVGEQLNTLIVAEDYKSIINLTGLISIALAFMNILPIPLLDGGQVMFLVLEKLRGKSLSIKTQERISKISFIVLILLSVLIILKDIWVGFIGEFIRKIF